MSAPLPKYLSGAGATVHSLEACVVLEQGVCVSFECVSCNCRACVLPHCLLPCCLLLCHHNQIIGPMVSDASDDTHARELAA
jgi:hypothetical protein